MIGLGEIVLGELASFAVLNHVDTQRERDSSLQETQRSHPGIYSSSPTAQRSHPGIYSSPATNQPRYGFYRSSDQERHPTVPMNMVCNKEDQKNQNEDPTGSAIPMVTQQNIKNGNATEADMSPTRAEMSRLLSPVKERLVHKSPESLATHTQRMHHTKLVDLRMPIADSVHALDGVESQNMKLLDIDLTGSASSSTSAGSEMADVESQSAGSESASDPHSPRSDGSDCEQLPLWSARVECSKLQTHSSLTVARLEGRDSTPVFGTRTPCAPSARFLLKSEDLDALQDEMDELTQDLMAMKAKVRTLSKS